MADVFFYHMTQSRLEEALPLLLEKSIARGWSVVVQTADESHLQKLDQHLWTFRNDSFLPHAREGETGAGEDQPIWITTGPENPNKALVRFLVAGASHDDLSPYERAIYMFDGHDNDAVTAARNRWKVEKEAGHSLTYWQQNEEGQWQKKADG